MKIYVSLDSASKAVGGDAVAEAVAAWRRDGDVNADIYFTGSRGMLWLEPMIEVDAQRGAGVSIPKHNVNKTCGAIHARMLTGLGLSDSYAHKYSSHSI